MNNWQTYRNGNLRETWNLERLARHRAAKLGYGGRQTNGLLSARRPVSAGGD